MIGKSIDLLEAGVVPVSVGQTCTGYVTRIEAQPTLYRSDVSYPVVVALDGDVAALWWGMKGVVEIGEK